jgi:hypothetical protein
MEYQPMKSQKYVFMLLATFLVTAQPAFAGESLGHSIQGSKHASKAMAHSAIGAAKLTSGVVAVPLMGIGEVGKAVGDSGKAMWDSANTPLPISDETITAGLPPFLKQDKKVTAGPSPAIKDEE